MDDLEKKLERLLNAAAKAPDGEAPEAPFGFSTRVAAQWMAKPVRGVLAAWESLSMRFAAVCLCVMLFSLASGIGSADAAADSGLPDVSEMTEQVFELAFFP